MKYMVFELSALLQSYPEMLQMMFSSELVLLKPSYLLIQLFRYSWYHNMVF